MTKEEFLKHAKTFASTASRRDVLDAALVGLELRRKDHLNGVKKFDATAAELEKAYFDADIALAEAEMKLAEHYASKLEG